MQIGMAVLMFGMHFLWHKGFEHVPEESFLTWVLVIHIVAWILQFVGHGVFESSSSLIKNASRHCWIISHRSSMRPSLWWWRSSK
jgi:uncharacterized membrane protein YGL010W